MTTETVPWDSTRYLKTDQDIAEYLGAAFETGEPSDVTHALATVARAKGVADTAKNGGIARGSLYKAIGEGANSTLSTLMSMMDALNVTLSVKPKAAV